MMMQRKIFNLLQSEGEKWNFRYLPLLRAPFDLTQPILVTEKVDGQTMQSRAGEVWKRFDLLPNNDPRKHTAPEEERYEVRPCRADDPAMKHLIASFNSAKEQFEEFGRRFVDDWIFFEGIGTKVCARYRGLEPAVRAFDIGRNGLYRPFLESLEILQDIGFPVVEHWTETFGNLENLLDKLATATYRDVALEQYMLEGWVLRQNVLVGGVNTEVVAKIRIKDLGMME